MRRLAFVFPWILLTCSVAFGQFVSGGLFNNGQATTTGGGGGVGTAPVLDGTPVILVFNTGSQAINFATSLTNDIVVICVTSEVTSGTAPTLTTGSITGTGDFSGITWSDVGGGHTMTQAVNPNGGTTNPGLRATCIWAFFSGALSGTNNITIPTSGANDSGSIIVFAFHGCGNTSAPFDVNASLPTLTDSPGSSVPTDSGISTTALGTAVITITVAANPTTGPYTDQTSTGGWTLVGANHINSGSNYSASAVQYQPFTSAQSGITSPFTQSWLDWMTMSVALVGT